MNPEFGVVAFRSLRVVSGMNGFFALNRLKTSAMASTLAALRSPNDRLTRRFSCEKGARRLQLTVSHGPCYSNVAVPLSLRPV